MEQKIHGPHIFATADLSRLSPLQLGLRDHRDWMNRAEGTISGRIFLGRRYDLRGHTFLSLDLRNTLFNGADLTGARFFNCRIDQAEFGDANLSGVQFTDTYPINCFGILPAGTPNRWNTFGWNYRGRLVIRAGCREFYVDAAREYWAGKRDRVQVLAAVEYLVAVATDLGWRI